MAGINFAWRTAAKAIPAKTLNVLGLYLLKFMIMIYLLLYYRAVSQIILVNTSPDTVVARQLITPLVPWVLDS